MGNINGGMATANMIDESAYPQLKQQGACIDVDVNGEWNEWTVLPLSDDDYKFSDHPFGAPLFSLAPRQGTVGASVSETFDYCSPCFAFIRAPSGAANVQTYQFECVFNWDYIMPGSQTATGTSQTQSTTLPTPCPPHHEGVLHTAQAIVLARMTHDNAAVTAKSHHSTAHKVGEVFKHIFEGPAEAIGAGLGALGVGGAYADAIGAVIGAGIG